jgi:signal transduction histidine kinase
MSGSLILLLIFLGYWLQKVYEDEYAVLKNETDYMFLNSIRGIEEEMIQELFLDPIAIMIPDSISPIRAGFTKNKGEGVFEKMIIQSENSFKKLDTSIQITVHTTKTDEPIEFRTKEKPSFRSMIKIGNDSIGEMKKFPIGSSFSITKDSTFKKIHKGTTGSLSLYISLSQKDSISLDSTFLNTSDTTVLVLLNDRFGKAIDDSEINLAYNIVQTNHREVSPRSIFLSESYNDLPSGEHYAVAFPEYKGFLLRQIIPEILFSIFLFGCIALSFFLVYQSLKKQQRLTEIKNDFISNVTHELKTPITTVGVAIEAMSNFNALQNPERTQEYLNISKHELARLGMLVDKVLKMSQFEKAEPELKIETLDLKELVREILNSMKLQFEKFRAQVDFEFSNGNFYIEGDKIHLTSVIYNLLDNALKYSPLNPNIQVNLNESDSQISMSVKDSGIGISNEFKEKIFEKFFRVPTGDTHNVKGHGLGLSYVASVVEKHHGTIEVESNFGEGTCFVVSLPKHIH